MALSVTAVGLCIIVNPAFFFLPTVPASFYLVLSGYLTQDYITIAKGAGLFVYGVLIISTIDNILRVKIIQAQTDVHPLTVIAGVIGGVDLFGVMGLFLGPILLPLLITYFETFRERFE
jgi:predicted PurR-regulated permease PerM